MIKRACLGYLLWIVTWGYTGLIQPVSAQEWGTLVALTTQDSVTVKFAGKTSYIQGMDLFYRIHQKGEVLSEGLVKADTINKDEHGNAMFHITGLQPKLWSLQDPQLYELAVYQAGEDGKPGMGASILGGTRIGFRTFEIRDRKFYLNGRVLFLRGFPINPPGRDLPDETGKNPLFARDYIKLLKSAGVNMIRTDTRVWLDACDELGMLTFQGRYGPGPGANGDNPPTLEQALPVYRQMFADLASHPSVVIYVLTNETDPVKYKDFLQAVHDDVQKLDKTRPIIGNAGFGRGQAGEIYDIHRYVGWYASNPQDWYEFSDWLLKSDAANQPFTVTECVGAYTADDGHFETMSKQMSTMLRWLGTAEDPQKASQEYQAELVKQVVEIARRMRTDRSGVAGIFPFTYFLGWANARKGSDIIQKPAFETLKTVYQPILISPECWKRNLYSGDTLKMRLCVSNDDDNGRALGQSQVFIEVINQKGAAVASTTVDFQQVPYYTNAWRDAALVLSTSLPKGDYQVRCRLLENGIEISRNAFEITIAPRSWTRVTGIKTALFDPKGTTAPAFRKLGIQFELVADLKKMPTNQVLVIGEEALSGDNFPQKEAVIAYLEKGGRILCLQQTIDDWKSDWLPVKYTITSRLRRSYTYTHPIGRNTALWGEIRPKDLHYWNELGRAKNGTPEVSLVMATMRPASVEDLKPCRVWAACDRMLGGIALLELFHGNGSIVFSQFRCAERVEDDPVAAKLLGNLVKYAGSKNHPGLLNLSKPIQWDLEAIRTGAFVSILQGFLPHSKVYSHTGTSKGRLGEDHSIDGFTLLGTYEHTANGWITRLPDPKAEGWGTLYGRLDKPATRFYVEAQNLGAEPAPIRIRIDGKDIGIPAVLQPGERRTVEWAVNRDAGLIHLEMRGNQTLLIKRSWFN